MKTFLTLLLMGISILGMSQQSTLYIFSESSEDFTIYANGIKVNSKLASTVTIPELTAGKVHVRIAFIKKGIPELNSQINIPSDGMIHNMQYKIVPSKKGPYSLVLVSDQSFNQSISISSNESSTEKEKKNGKKDEKGMEDSEDDMEASEEEGSVPENINFNVTAGGNTIGMNVFQPENAQKEDKTLNQKDENSKETAVNFNVTLNVNEKGMNQSGKSEKQSLPAYNLPQVKDGLMCNGPFPTSQDFMQLKYKVGSGSMYMDMARVEDSKEYMNKNCLMAIQVADLVKLVQMNDSRLDLAKYGYMHTYDQSNYGVVVDAIQSDFDKENLLSFIGSYGTSGPINQNVNINTDVNHSQKVVINTSSQPTNTQTPISQETTNKVSYSDSYSAAMDDDDFEEALEAADEPVGEEAKMKVAKGVFDDVTLKTSQIIRVAELFISEDRRLDFAKFAFPRASDKDKYFRLNKLFISESRITELTQFVKENK